MSDDYNVNPQITSVTIGTRSLREITLYPLSIADELKFSDIIAKAISKYLVENKDENDEEKTGIAMATAILRIIRENVPKLLKLVTDEDIGLDELMNRQLLEIAEKIYDVNFEGLEKNVESLSKKIKILFQPERLIPSSVSATQDIDSSTSQSEDTGKEE